MPVLRRENIIIDESKTDYPVTKDTIDKYEQIITLGQKVFRGSGLQMEGALITPNDVELINQFLVDVAPINPIIVNPGFLEHLTLTDKYCQYIGNMYIQNGIDLDINSLRAAGLLHDFGRIFSHRRGRNERIKDVLFSRMGIVNSSFTDKIYPDSIVTDENLVNNPTWIETNPYWAIVLMADLLSKKDKSGYLRPWSTVPSLSSQNQALPNQSTMWPSEFDRQTKIIKLLPQVNLVYHKLAASVEHKTGKTMEEIVGEMNSLIIPNYPH